MVLLHLNICTKVYKWKMKLLYYLSKYLFCIEKHGYTTISSSLVCVSWLFIIHDKGSVTINDGQPIPQSSIFHHSTHSKQQPTKKKTKQHKAELIARIESHT